MHELSVSSLNPPLHLINSSDFALRTKRERSEAFALGLDSLYLHRKLIDLSEMEEICVSWEAV